MSAQEAQVSVGASAGSIDADVSSAHNAAPKTRTKAEIRAHRLAAHRWLRLGIQLVFLIMAPGLFSAAFNGVKYIFTQIGEISAIEPTSFVIVLLAILAFTIVFGRFFCGYACAFGMLGDVVFQLVDALCKRLKVAHPRIPDKVMEPLSLVKYGVLIAICVMCLVGVWGSISGYSPWVAFAGFTSGSLSGIAPMAFVVLALCVIGMAFNERLFCRVLCPMGAVFSLMPVCGFSTFTRTEDLCVKSCGRCRATCPVGVWPDKESIMQGECISCGRCADTCPIGNINLVAIERRIDRNCEDIGDSCSQSVVSEGGEGIAVTCAEDIVGSGGKGAADRNGEGIEPKRRPRVKTAEGWHLLRGTQAPVVLTKAAVLLVLCWIVGVTRYVPAFSEVFS